MADRIQNRRDTKARWAEVNPILLEGEHGDVLDDPNLYKVGDGVKRWNELPFRGYNGTVVNVEGIADNIVMSQKGVTDALKKRDDKIFQLEPLGTKTNSIDDCLGGVYITDDDDNAFAIKTDDIIVVNENVFACIDEENNATIHSQENDNYNYNWRIIIEESSRFAGFPSIISFGDKFIVAFREGDSHVDKNGTIACKVVQSDFTNISKKMIVLSGGYQEDKGTYIDFRDPRLLILPNNELLLTVFTIDFGPNGDQALYTKNRAYAYKYTINKDLSLSLIQKIEITPITEDIALSTCGAPIIYNGVIYIMCYDDVLKKNYLYTSSDYGSSFKYKSTLPFSSIDEAAIVFNNNILYVISRDGRSNADDGYNAIYPSRIFTSYDLGATWCIAGQCPFFYHGLDSKVINGYIVVCGRSSFDNIHDKQNCLLTVLCNSNYVKSIIISDNNIENNTWDSNYSQIIEYEGYVYICYYTHSNGVYRINLKRVSTKIINK